MRERFYSKQTKKNEESEILGYGLAFIKTRVGNKKVRHLQKAIEEFGREAGVEMVDVIIDDSASRDIDRKQLDWIFHWIEATPIQLLLINKLSDITDDADDLSKFLCQMNEAEVRIICMDDSEIIVPDSISVEDKD